MNQNIFKWYAVHTRSHFEKKVYDSLSRKSIDAFLPQLLVMSRRRDRKKKIMVPMLPGYLFVQTDLNPEEHLEILKTVGLVRMIGFNGKPVPANEAEVSSLRILSGTDRTVQNRSFMNKGDRVMIMEGSLKGVVGFYIRHKGQSDRVVVSIELLQRSLEVEVGDWALEKAPV
jgi:transcription antitermination factor NusG